MDNLLNVSDLKLAFGDKILLDQTNFNIAKRDKICLVGRNGSGKSTLLKFIMGEIDGDCDDQFRQPGLTISYLAQESDFGSYQNAFNYVVSGCTHLQRQENNDQVDYLAQAWLDRVEIKGDHNLNAMSGGEAKRVCIAQALVGEPDLLLVDEPTNHLDIEAILWLEQILNNCQGAMIIISHDRTFLKNVSNKTWWIENKQLLSNNRGFGHFDDWCEEVYASEQKRIERLNKELLRENKWLERGVTARRKRNQGRLRRLHQLRETKASQISKQNALKIDMDQDNFASKMVIECRKISKKYDNNILFSDFSTRILKGDRIGVAGPNGCGKTTLLQTMLGQITPDEGRIRHGITVDLAYIDQKRSQLYLDKTPKQILCPNGGDEIVVWGKSRHVIAYLKDFMFTPDQAHVPIKTFSGGERNRLMLAKVLSDPSNFLILDEPTNDLDMDTLEMLKDILLDYKGTVIIVSHDRDFLDSVVNSMIVLDGKGSISEYAGGYSDYLVQKQASQPQVEPKKRKKASKVVVDKPKIPKKLSYNQQHRLEQLPQLIDDCTMEIKEFELLLSDPRIYEENRDYAQELGHNLGNLKAKLQTLEEEWLELEEIKENIS